jgi:hypothetical protein
VITTVRIVVRFGGASLPSVTSPAFPIPSESICDAIFNTTDMTKDLVFDTAIQNIRNPDAPSNPV